MFPKFAAVADAGMHAKSPRAAFIIICRLSPVAGFLSLLLIIVLRTQFFIFNIIVEYLIVSLSRDCFPEATGFCCSAGCQAHAANAVTRVSMEFGKLMLRG